MPQKNASSPVCYTRLIGQINDKSAKEVMKDIDAANSDYKKKRVLLTVTSGGGLLYYAFALFNQIKTSQKPVDVLATGYCMSAAVMIMQAARKRIAHANTFFMVHPSHNSIEKEKSYDEFMTIVDAYKHSHDLFVKLTITRGGIRRAKFESLYKPRKYFSAREALKMGFIDKVIE